MSIVRRLFGLAFGLLLLALITIFALLATTSGSRWLVAQAIDATGQSISLTGVEGRLIDELSVQHLRYVSAGEPKVIVELETLRLQWNPLALWRGQVHIQRLSATKLGLVLPPASHEAAPIVVRALPSGWSVRLDGLAVDAFTLDSAQQMTTVDNIRASARWKGTRLQLREVALQTGGVELGLDGEVSIQSPYDFDARLQLKDQQRSARLGLQVSGSPDDYRFDADSSIDMAGIPAIAAQFFGQGSLDGVKIDKLQATTLDGSVSGNGQLEWQNTLRVVFELQGTDLNAAQLNPELKGRLNVAINGEWKAQRLVAMLDADGQLMDYPLIASLRLEGGAEQWLLKQGRVQSGPNQLDFEGGLSKQGMQNFSWKLDAPKLATLYPQLSGKLTGSGVLNGSWNQLRGKAAISGEKLAYQQTRLASLALDFAPLKSTGADAENYRLGVIAKDLIVADQTISEASLQVKGSLQRQRISAEVSAQSGERYALALRGLREAQAWGAQITDSSFERPGKLSLTQKAPTRLQLDWSGTALAGTLSAYCLSGKIEKVCLQGTLINGNLNADMNLQKLPLQGLLSKLEQQTIPPMPLSGELSIKQSRSRWKLDAKMSVDPENRLAVKLAFDQDSRKLSGTARVALDELKNLAILSEQLSHTKGKLTADLSLSGTDAAPEVGGIIQLQEASTKLPDIGLSLENIRLTATLLDFSRADIEGEIQSGEGQLKVSGKAQWWPVGAQALNLKLQGQNLLLVDLPEVYALASPALTVTASADRISVDGEVNIPKLAVRLEDISAQAIGVSEDARIVGVDAVESPPAARLPVYARIRLQLGDQASLQGMGLDVKLAGELDISESPDRPLRASGKIAVREGRYTAYGQDLSLSESQLIFNGPVSDPGLDLKAKREIKARGEGRDVTVGVLIGGTIKAPVSELFSSPSMPDSDALSYLLTGGSLSTAGGGEGALMVSALTHLGVKGSSGLVEKIQNSTGLSTFAIDSGDDVSETALKMGKYLTPQLYVQYVKRIFTDSGSIQARYDVNDRVYIETESGDNRSIDLKLQFER